VSADAEGVDVAVIGAGSIGIAVAYFLVTRHQLSSVALIDARPPMSLTSASSGENYRNWWPHPLMTAFTNRSISLMEDLDGDTGGRLGMTRGGYALATRQARPEALIDALRYGYSAEPGHIRVHETAGPTYHPPQSAPWRSAPDGVDVLLDPALIRRTFPSFAEDVCAVVHVRRAGSISVQQMGQAMLETLAASGVRLRRAEVRGIETGSPFVLHLDDGQQHRQLRATCVVNAAGPFAADACLLGETLPLRCVYQQKIAFPDQARVIPRGLPFSIDLDAQVLAWTPEERALLAADPTTRPLTEPMPGGVHCRPDGPSDGGWIRIGWACNRTPGDPHAAEPSPDGFPDLALRAASRLQPGLATYLERLPRGSRHYGGYYTMTDENWPLIGPTPVPGFYIAAGFSGFGSMAACAAGELCAAWVTGSALPPYAGPLSLARYEDAALMAELDRVGQGIL